jgi:hypothetical protein
LEQLYQKKGKALDKASNHKPWQSKHKARDKAEAKQ